MVADYKAGRAEAPDILRQQMGLVRQLVETLHVPVVDLPGFEADDVIATLATQAAARGDDVIIVTGRSRHLPAGRGSPRQGPLQPAGRVGLRPLRRSRDRGAHRGAAGPLPAVRGAAGRPVGQPPRRSRRGREDGGQAHQHLRGPRRHLRPPRRAVAQAAPEPGRRRAGGPGQRRRHPPPCGTSRSRSTRPRRPSGDGIRRSCGRLFDFLEFRTLWDRFIEATSQGERGGRCRGSRRRRPRGRRGGACGRRPRPSSAAPTGKRAAAALAMAGRVGGPRGALPAPRAGLRCRCPPGDGPVAGRLVRRWPARRTPRCGPPWESCSARTGSTCLPTTPKPSCGAWP